MTVAKGLVAAGLWTVAGASAQIPANHPAGYVLAVDLDLDGCQDALVFDTQSVHAWFGRRSAPWLVPGPSTAIPSARRACEPKISGRYLWVASLGHHPTVIGALDAWRIHPDGTLTPFVSYPLPAGTANSELMSLRISPLRFDFGNDGLDDVLALWTESPRQSQSSMRAEWFSPWTSGAIVDLPPLPVSMLYHELVGLHPARNVGQSADEHLCIVSAPPAATQSGIVFATIGRGPAGPVLSSEVTFQNAPPTRFRGGYDERARSLYGAFSPTPFFGGPVLQFVDGPSIAFDPTPSPPFVAASGQWLETSLSGALVADSAADYDGDGADEVAILEHLPGVGDVLVVTDPMPQWRQFQAFWYPSAPWTMANPFWPFGVVHAAPADVDGDGMLDLVVSMRGTATQSGISLYRGMRRAAPLSPTQLVRLF